MIHRLAWPAREDLASALNTPVEIEVRFGRGTWPLLQKPPGEIEVSLDMGDLASALEITR